MKNKYILDKEEEVRTLLVSLTRDNYRGGITLTVGQWSVATITEAGRLLLCAGIIDAEELCTDGTGHIVVELED